MAPGGGAVAARNGEATGPLIDMSGVPLMKRAKTQVVIIGLAFMVIPGGFNAITSMAGSVTQGHPELQANAGTWLNAFFAIFCLFAPAVVNIVGARVAMFCGGLTYILYVLALLVSIKHDWVFSHFFTISAAILGIGAAMIWVGQGALTLSYAPSHLRGSYFALFWMLFNIGGAAESFFIGFLPNLGNAAGANDATFYLFMGTMAIGCALILTLAPLAKVIRADGQPVVQEEAPALLGELRGMASWMMSPKVLALLPFMLYSNWCYNYQNAVFNAKYFDAPTQGLSGSFYWGAQMVASYILGFRFLDSEVLPLKARARASLVVVTTITAVAWAAGAVSFYSSNFPAKPERFNQTACIVPMVLYTLWGAADALVQVWINWFLGQLSNSPQELSRLAGVYKFFNTAGNWAGSKANGLPPATQLWINIALLIVSIPGAACGVASLQSKDADDKLVQADP